MHYYQFHIGDYKSHTHHLSQMEDLAFRRLLDHYYLHEQPIKQRDIARQIGMREHEQDVLTVLNEFFVSTDDGFINPRADDEIAKYRKFIEDGKRGAAKRWLKGGDGEGNSPPIATPIATINHNPLTNNHKPKRESATVVACPPDVGLQEWEDWLSLRKAKKAPVTETVLKSARKEAEKAGMSFNAFLTIWCARGSQGLEANWLRSNDKTSFAQQAADVARTTVPAQHSGRDPVLLKIEADRQKAAPMPEHIRQQINQVLRKV
jgi:uncharacterized protein YdaU (DUF1376 family)